MSESMADKLARDEQIGDHPYIRPKDASTLLILDRTSGGPVRVLMGRRHMRHTFMPGKYVFPGGRLDASDSRIKVTSSYHPEVEAKLRKDPKAVRSDGRLKGLALAAIRETYEEAGLFIGRKSDKPDRIGAGFEAFEQHGVRPDLAPMRLVARAITPPKRPRRFDTRFFAVWSGAIADRLETGMGPSGELEDVAWLTLEEARTKDLPFITKTILSDLETRLASDPDLNPATGVPYYYFRAGSFVRTEI
ncbi:NUDIX hydrolase [Roseibium sp. RKSG952]|uniref:NUDIX hydrolase n=1 Tax=Roseibium sp. RKSG952 TaxID=2529384 RepID=UPI0012BC31DF|nr:NUDIX hydrolase [Roseibium sp. RKSG952]MTH97705.1 NUDIX hydrolase [Roseibium sp. RKSG952]